jgi:hypothetical protein
MTDDAFDFEQPRPVELIRQIAVAGSITPAEAVDMAYQAGYAAGRAAEVELTGRIVRVGNNPPPEVRT